MCSVSNAVHIMRALFTDDSGSLVKITHERVSQQATGSAEENRHCTGDPIASWLSTC